MELDAQNSGFPVPRTSLIGRDRELAALRNIVQRPETRLLTLTGVGGSGKTRLALRIAADLAPDFPRRTWVVELAPVSDAELLPIVIATTIGLRDISSTAPMIALEAFFAVQPALLVLDNCEHLIDACATLVDTLLGSCPDLRVITTSREPLQITGERQYRVLPLATPDPDAIPEVDTIAASPAAELFVSRAQYVMPSFHLTPDNAVTVARICVRLGGIPLALELAAARVHLLGIEQILSRLDDTFRFLNGGNRIAPTRHQTLRAALDWSEALLTEAERTVFRRLAVFAGEFQLTAAEAVCSEADFPPGDVFEALMGLVNKSLVLAESGNRSAWYHLLEPVRQYAVERLEARDELAKARARHAHAYLALAERAATELWGPNQEAWLNDLERSQSNVRKALEWAQTEQDIDLALRLATALVPFWEAHGHLVEGLRWLRQALAWPSGQVDPAVRMRALRGAGRLAFLFEDDGGSQYREAEILHQESLELAQAIGDKHGIASALTELGMVYRLQRDLVRSQAVLTEALGQCRALNDPSGIALTLLNLGATVGLLADPARAVHLVNESMERFNAIGDLRSVAIAQVMLSRAALAEGDIDTAERLSIDAMTTHARLHDRWFVAFDLMALAEALIANHQPRQAVTLCGAARALSETLSSLVGGISFTQLTATIDSLRQESWFHATWTDGYSLDLVQVVQVAQAMLSDPSQNRSVVRLAKPDPVPITRREFEVARLIAEGHTDRQIADRLFLSVGTVGNHVHHILRKLELSSRVQVASWLATHEQREATVTGSTTVESRARR